MKKIKISFLLIFISLFSQNSKAMISKKNVETIQFWTMILAVIDQASFLDEYKDPFLPKKRSFSFGDLKIKLLDPQLKIEVPKFFNFLQFDSPNDSHFKISPLPLANKTLVTALEKDWNLLSLLVDYFIRMENLKHNLKANDLSMDLKQVMQIEGIVFLTEKLTELITDITLNSTMKNQKILKRLSRVILLTAINTGGAALRKLVAQKMYDLENGLPVVGTTLVDKFFENLMVETFAELLQRFIIADPEKQKLEEKKKRFQEKLEEIIAAAQKDKKSEAKPLEEKKSFNFVPVAI